MRTLRPQEAASPTGEGGIGEEPPLEAQTPTSEEETLAGLVGVSEWVQCHRFCQS